MNNLSILQSFPKDFVFGVATSAYQIEGNNFGECGKSIWDEFAKQKLNGVDGAYACNHIQYFKDDIKLIKDAGFKAYRFSFSWPRIFPNDDNTINTKGLDFYDRLLDEILKCDLEPFPTLYHWDLPIRYNQLGGWENKDTCKRFADYSYTISEKLGDKFQKIATINEPWCVSWLSHYLGEHAPGKKSLSSATVTMHNILLAHGLSVQALRSNRNLQVGVVLNNEYPEPYSQDTQDIDAAKLFDSIYNYWFADGIFKGSYPKIAMELLSSHLPSNYESDLKIISQGLDWVGINYYTRSIIKYYRSDDGVNYKCVRGNLKKTDMDWEFFPEGLTYFLRRIYNEYDSKIPIYITENGMANRDLVSSKNKVFDEDRIEYFQLHLNEVLKCLNEGISLKGYFAWSLLDNYEWSFGYEKRFGLVHVNYKNYKRTPKESFKQFSKYL